MSQAYHSTRRLSPCLTKDVFQLEGEKVKGLPMNVVVIRFTDHSGEKEVIRYQVISNTTADYLDSAFQISHEEFVAELVRALEWTKEEFKIPYTHGDNHG